MILKLVAAGYPVLREVARNLTPGEIRSAEIQQLIASMFETMRAAPGVGLAAPQVGLPLQLAVIEDRIEMPERERFPVEPHVIINPKLRLEGERDVRFYEGCLSLPGFTAETARARAVTVECLNERAEPVTIRATGWYARILQHEIDHLNGTLYIDRMDSRTFMTRESYEARVVPWRQSLRAFIQREAQPVEKFSHMARLYGLAQAIGEGMEYDDDVVFAAAWLHDLGVFEKHRPTDPEELAAWDNVAYAALETPGILIRFGFPEAKIEAVVEAIRTHQPAGNPQAIEGVILRDADILEQLGAVGALRTICKIGRDTRFHEFGDAVAGLRKAVEGLPGMIRLESARVLAVPKIAALRNFLEAAGEEL